MTSLMDDTVTKTITPMKRKVVIVNNWMAIFLCMVIGIGVIGWWWITTVYYSCHHPLQPKQNDYHEALLEHIKVYHDNSTPSARLPHSIQSDKQQQQQPQPCENIPVASTTNNFKNNRIVAVPEVGTIDAMKNIVKVSTKSLQMMADKTHRVNHTDMTLFIQKLRGRSMTPDQFMESLFGRNTRHHLKMGYHHRQVYYVSSPYSVDDEQKYRNVQLLDRMQKNFFPCNPPLYNAGKKTLSHIRYLHIPKTGTTIAATVLHYCCEFSKNIEVDILTGKYKHQIWRHDATCRKCLIQPTALNGDFFSHIPYLPIVVPSGELVTEPNEIDDYLVEVRAKFNIASFVNCNKGHHRRSLSTPWEELHERRRSPVNSYNLRMRKDQSAEEKQMSAQIWEKQLAKRKNDHMKLREMQSQRTVQELQQKQTDTQQQQTQLGFNSIKPKVKVQKKEIPVVFDVSTRFIDFTNLLTVNATITPVPNDSGIPQQQYQPYLLTMLRNPLKRIISQISFIRKIDVQIDTFGVPSIEEIELLILLIRSEFWDIPKFLYSIRHVYLDTRIDYQDNLQLLKQVAETHQVAKDIQAYLQDKVLYHNNTDDGGLQMLEAKSKLLQYTQDQWTNEHARNDSLPSKGNEKDQEEVEILSINEMLNPDLYSSKLTMFVTRLKTCLATFNTLSPTTENTNVRPKYLHSKTDEIKMEKDKCRWLLLASYPGMKGCQVKMILGYSCLEHRIELTPTHVQLAKERLEHEFAFFGITDHWNESISLFHTQYGGDVYPEEYVINRASDYSKDLETYKGGYRIQPKTLLQSIQFYDEYDEELYTFALQLFYQRLQQYAIQ